MEQEYRVHYYDPFDQEIEGLFEDEKDERCRVGIFFGIVLAFISGAIGFLIEKKKYFFKKPLTIVNEYVNIYTTKK